MTSGKPRVLLVTGPETARGIFDRIEAAGLAVETATDLGVATATLSDGGFDAVVSREEVPDGKGVAATGDEILRAVRGVDGGVPVVLFGEDHEPVASDAVAAGLADYVPVGTDGNHDRLVGRVRNAVARRQAVRRAEQQARTNEVIRDVHQALVRADSREAVEESVCEQFARSEQYTFAWIADVDDDGLTFRAMGVEGGAVEGRGGLSVDEGTAFTRPAHRAVERQEVVVLRDVDDRGGAWEAALDRPFEAVAAVPFVYDDDVYGVLLLYTDRPGAFGEEERQVLAELGENVAYALNAVDVRRKVRLREREFRRQNEHLEEFAEVVSHDLRNPLTVARGYVELLEGDDEAVERITDSLSRMETIIDDMLALARQGRSVGETEPVDLAVAAREAWGTVDTGDATLEAAPGLLEADRSRLVQSLENLFRNAVEHGGAGTVRVDPTDDGFHVADDGSGLPEGKRGELFDSGVTTDDGGTGFGLAIVRSIAEAHGWEVTAAESEAGGARFEFSGVATPADEGASGTDAADADGDPPDEGPFVDPDEVDCEGE